MTQTLSPAVIEARAENRAAGGIDPARLDQLAESIREVGLLQPIVVRQVVAEGTCSSRLVACERPTGRCEPLRYSAVLSRGVRNVAETVWPGAIACGGGPGAMKAITIWQPWASLIADGRKLYETRAYAPPGALIGQRIAIHAGRHRSGANAILARNWGMDDLPLGAVVCTARLVAAHLTISQPGHPGMSMVYVSRSKGLAVAADPDWQADYSGIPTDPYGDYAAGRWAWRMLDVQVLDPPVPARGRQGWWEWTP